MAFDQHDDNHAIASTSKGAFVTFDGGAAWTRSSGISSSDDGREIVHISVISQHEGNVVWLEGTDGYSSNQIFRSTDGGRSFRSVLKATADVTITNGTSLWPKPATSDVLYFSYGTSFGDYGADIYRYDHALQAVTKTHNAFTSIPALEFNPSNPTVIYLGVTLDGPRN